MESDENSSPDDEERINFLATIPHESGCEVLQLVPKKPVVSSSETNAMYQPCTNTIIQLKQSSFSAFRDMSEMKYPRHDKECVVEDEDDDGNNAAAAVATYSSSHVKKEDQQQ